MSIASNPTKQNRALIMPKTLETDRVNLRRAVLSDAPLISKYCSDYDVAKMTLSIPHPFPLVSAEVWIMKDRAAWEHGSAYSYVIDMKNTDTLIGEASEDIAGVMSVFKNKQGQPELGYWIARPFWGQGLATHTALSVMSAYEHCFGSTQIYAAIFDDNLASGHVLEKLGFTRTGSSAALFSMARLRKAAGYEYVRLAS